VFISLQNQNIIIFLDKIKKLLELGHIPKALLEIDGLVDILNKEELRKNGLNIMYLVPEDPLNPTRIELKLNEIATFLNKRFV